MSRTSAKNDGWVRIFEVPCFERHVKGYTVYKIVSRVFPCQCPEASTQVTVWKRFSEFKKLHAEMSSLHAALYLKGTFPPLSRTSYFNRFESAVLEERRAAIRAALQFVALHPPLFTSAPFSRFFEDGDCRTVNETDRLPPALSPQPSLTDSDVSAPLTDSDVTRAAAGGVSAPPADGDGSAAAADGLDPLLPAAAGSAGGPSNLQLLSEPAQPDLLSHLNTVPSPPSGEPSLDTLSDGDGELPDLSADEWPADRGPGPRPATDLGLAALTLDGAPEPPELPEVPVGTPPSPPASLPASPGERPPTPPAPAPGADPGQALPHTPAPARAPPTSPGKRPPHPAPGADPGQAPAPARAPPSPARALSEPPAGPGPPDAGDYLLTAAEAISRAQQAESQCQWGLAFACYQDGIGALINGVQGDPSAERREAVRRKTALYIGRAEQLAALCRDEPDQLRRRRLSGLCVEGGRHLERYKVLGLAAGGHLMVADRRAGSQQRLLVKVVVKCACSPDLARAATVLPERVPHMVQLHRLVETDTAYYLVLEYLPHGRLFDWLAGLTQAATEATASPDLPAELEPAGPASAGESPPDPADPTDPAHPTDPTDPAHPTDPADPTDPAVPPDPAHLTDPADPADPAHPTDPAPEPEPAHPAADAMSSSYLQLFEEFAASARRSGSVSLARNLSCPEPEPGAGEPEPGAAEPEPAAEGSPDRLLSRSQQLLSAVERTLRDTGRRQRDPPPPAAGAGPDRGAPPPAGAAGEPDGGGRPCAAAARRRPTLDEQWWSRGGGDEAAPPEPEPERERSAAPARPSADQLRLWTAQLVVTLERLHQQGVVCRFLRPENVLLTAERGAALTYFCRLRCAAGRAPPAAERGRLYAAPELWTPGAAVTAAADWWSLGALLWELHGDGPLWTRHPAGLAAHTALRPPASAGPAARSLLAALLRPDPRRRPDARHIRRHAFFAGLDWSRL